MSSCNGNTHVWHWASEEADRDDIYQPYLDYRCDCLAMTWGERWACPVGDWNTTLDERYGRDFESIWMYD